MIAESLHTKRESKVWAVVRVASGNCLEMYDFMVFGYYAPSIARAFFPTSSAFASLMLSLMTFGTGFLMRPIGAVVLGSYLDRHGRRKGLVLTLALMSAGTLLLACLPGYRTIGMWAPLLAVMARLIQGFSAGAELGGVSIYLSEIAPPGQKGFYVSWQSGSQQVAVVFASLLGVFLSRRIPAEAMMEWGWRIPMLIGCAIIPVLFVIRRSLRETEEFLAKKNHPTLGQIVTTLGKHWPAGLIGVLLVTMTTVSFYLITAYTPTFGSTVLHLAESDNLLVTLCVGLSNLFWLPIMGALSDRVGRRPLLLLFTSLTLLTAYPAVSWLVETPSFSKLLAVELWLSFLYASYNGAMVVYLTEIMPPEVRASGFSLAYSLATALFGGFTPAINTYLIHVTGNRAAPGWWLTFAAACGLVASFFSRRLTKSRY